MRPGRHSRDVLACAVAAGGIILILFNIMASTKFKIAGAVVVVAMAVAIVLQFQYNKRLEQDNQTLREQLIPLDQLRADNERLTKMQNSADQSADQKKVSELLRLRGEVTGLKRQLAEAAKLREQDKRALPKPNENVKEATPEPLDPAQQLAISKMNYGKQWMLAFIMYSSEHQGQFPASFDQAASFFQNSNTDTNRTPAELQIMYLGSLSTITNPASTIVIRGQQPWQTPDGGWVNDYSFADGHVEIHRENDGNFETWEKQHVQLPPAQ